MPQCNTLTGWHPLIFWLIIDKRSAGLTRNMKWLLWLLHRSLHRSSNRTKDLNRNSRRDFAQPYWRGPGRAHGGKLFQCVDLGKEGRWPTFLSKPNKHSCWCYPSILPSWPSEWCPGHAYCPSLNWPSGNKSTLPLPETEIFWLVLVKLGRYGKTIHKEIIYLLDSIPFLVFVNVLIIQNYFQTNYCD